MLRTAFSYYGGKGMLSGKYPAPRYRRIVEPFAGGAAYSLRWHKHDCILIDKNENLIRAWNYIKKPNFDELKLIPEKISAGTKLSELGNFSAGFKFILRAAANVGTGGQNKKMETITKIGAVHFHRNTVRKVLFWHDKIQHWKIFQGRYNDFFFGDATYFIDPPYQNSAGELYKFGSKQIDYNHLKQYVKMLKGQIIITENDESEWIQDFKKYDLKRSCGLNGSHISNRRQSEVFIML